MVEITKYARNLLLDTLSANLEYSNDFGTPPIFNWYRNMIESSLLINNCRYIRRGQYRYNLGQSLGFAHITIDYVGRTRFIIITDYEINENSLFSWQDSTEESGIVPKEKTRIHKNWRKINKQPLFGYKFVRNDKGEYNLLNNQGQLLTQWFKSIKTPFKQPYGQYKIIAHLNIGGFAYALSIDGQTYPLNRMWKEVYGESITYLKELILSEEKNWKNVIRLTESQFHKMLVECISKIMKKIV